MSDDHYFGQFDDLASFGFFPLFSKFYNASFRYWSIRWYQSYEGSNIEDTHGIYVVGILGVWDQVRTVWIALFMATSNQIDWSRIWVLNNLMTEASYTEWSINVVPLLSRKIETQASAPNSYWFGQLENSGHTKRFKRNLFDSFFSECHLLCPGWPVIFKRKDE